LLQIDRAEIVVPKAHEPKADLLDAGDLAGKDD